MHIRVDNLHVRPRTIEFSEPVDDFPALVALAEQGDIVFKGEVSGELTADMAGDVVRIRGRVSGTFGLSCSRCLCPMERSFDLPVNLCYHQAGASGSVDVDEAEEIELTLRDMELIPYSGDEIDPAPEIAQELIMALPQAALCRDDCAGLCPVCGCDLNRQTCRCEKPVFHEGLARLKDLKINKE